VLRQVAGDFFAMGEDANEDDGQDQ
jgi:hypothetical protein